VTAEARARYSDIMTSDPRSCCILSRSLNVSWRSIALAGKNSRDTRISLGLCVAVSRVSRRTRAVVWQAGIVPRDSSCFGAALNALLAHLSVVEMTEKFASGVTGGVCCAFSPGASSLLLPMLTSPLFLALPALLLLPDAHQT